MHTYKLLLCFRYGKAGFLRPNLHFCKGSLGVLAYLMQVKIPNTTPVMYYMVSKV